MLLPVRRLEDTPFRGIGLVLAQADSLGFAFFEFGRSSWVRLIERTATESTRVWLQEQSGGASPAATTVRTKFDGD